MKRNLSALKKALQFGVSGAVGGFVGNLITEPFMQFDRVADSASFFDSVLSTARWFGLVGGGIAAAIGGVFGGCLFILLEGGQIVCENVDTGAVSYLRSGDQKKIGNCTVTVGNSDLPAQTSAKVPPTIISVQPAANSFASSQFSLKFRNRVIPLSAGTQLLTSDIPSLTATGFNGVVATVNFHPKDELLLGLKNLSDRAWWATDIQGDLKMVEPENTLTLALGTKIEFGEIEGEIV